MRPKGRKQHNLFLIEGGNGVTAALQARWPLQRLLLPPDELGAAWQELAQSAGVETQTVSEELLEYLSEAQTSPDVIAVAQMPIEHDLQLEGLTLVLDGIGDPGNIGTLVRSA
jgi:TrmH family RNA methyltransferase